ncbi:hypothetical protein L2C91_13860 [Rosenbergiella epipactidis]|uniref:hypothetical protein n=1 Tax=Rosenbergiella epipactidis TaxID=1544694 RepID=UPI002026C7F7|nr:hypothetical protein [Rosenbergiella epipactidis]MCL9669450.1 hypothetical protein [Rosenbergiella epipactidis]
MMKVVTCLTLSEVSEATDTSQVCSEVLISGKSTGITIYGKVLEAAIQVDEHRYLLFVTDGVIFEELLTVLLFDTYQGVLDKIVIGDAYTTGHIENLEVFPHSVHFHFIGDNTWTIKVLGTPTIKLPFTDPKGITRPLGLRKYLDITRSTFKNAITNPSSPNP